MSQNKKTPNDPAPNIDFAGPAALGDGPHPVKKNANSKPLNPKPPKGPSAKKKSSPSKNRFSHFLSGILWVLAGLGMAALVAAFGLYAYYSQDLPKVGWLKHYSPPTVTYLYADDGQVVGEYSHQRRIVKPLSDIPTTVIQAFLAVEDDKFYE
ncbi:MAG: hypothetical protein ACRCTY_04695, partial [Candidatus Adiutrix sp.]